MSAARKPENAWLQAARLTFLALYAVTLLIGLRWAVSNVRAIAPQNIAVVMRLGAVHRVHGAGLLWAWPPPFERIVLLPSAETVAELRVQGLQRSEAARQAEMSSEDDAEAPMLSDALAGSGYLLTGDAAIVQMDLRVFYKLSDPVDYLLQEKRIGPALDRVVTRSALAVCAARDLDTILVARPELVTAGGAGDAAVQRERLRGDLVQHINRSLDDLRQAGVGLGIQVVRVDVQSSLPPATVGAFNAVLTASQQAERNIAEAQADAAWTLQQANQSADRSLQVAQAAAAERVARAQSDTAAVQQLAQAIRDDLDPGLLQRAYRERIGAVIARAGSVTLIDARDESRLVVPGAGP